MILLVGIPLLVAVLAVAIYLYLTVVPDRLADDYRERAKPAFTSIADAMDRVYASFDTYLDDSGIPRREIRNVDDYDEFKRRVAPVYQATERALEQAKRAVGKARREIGAERDDLEGVPSAPFLGGRDPIADARDVAGRASSYTRRSLAYLRDYERFVDYELDAVDLRQRGLEVELELPAAGASLEEFNSAVDDAQEEFEAYREQHLKLKPHPDAERLHEIDSEAITITIDYLDDLETALGNLDVSALAAADGELLEESKRVSDQQLSAWQEFAARSGIQRVTVKLADEAEAIEEAMSELGSGKGSRGANRTRIPPPAPAAPGGGGGGGGGGQKA